MTDEACAFVPGHVTAFFSAHPDADPARTGSRGGGLALTHGVTVRVTPGSGLALNGEAIEMEAVTRVLDALGVEARVEGETPLPLGAGFGVSGAMALGAALAANALLGCGYTENGLVTLAHSAEVEAGSGLGDVVAQARGGIPLRLEPGAPGFGRMDGIPARTRVEYLALGELSTEEVLSGDTGGLSRAGEDALATVLDDPTLSTFMDAGRRFANEADLLPPGLEAIVEDVEAAGGRASMAMLGETVFALGTGLSDAGYEPAVCDVHPPGAGLVDDSSR